MKITTEPTSTARMTPLAVFISAMRADLKRAMQPLYALRTGWQCTGLGGACRAFLQAQRDNFPQGIFSLLLLAQGLVLAVLLVAIALDGILAWGGLGR